MQKESTNYSYDAAGNQISAGAQSHSYDSQGRRTGSTLNGLSTTYRYNALGQRTEKTQGTTTRRFSYDLKGQLLGEYTASAQPVREYVYLNDLPVAVLDYPNGAASPTPYNILADRLNTPREITNTSNTALWRWEGEPFGAQTPNEDVDGDGVNFSFNLRFPGQYYDQETGLNYNYFRDYDAATGRYIQSDPIGLAGGMNTYGYVGGNPVGAVDPTGQNAITLAPLCVSNPILCGGVVGLGAVLSTPTGQKLTTDAAKAVKQLCDSNDDDPCGEILADIQDAMKELTRRYMHQCRDKKNQWDTHAEQFENKKRYLAKLVAKAEANNCIVPSQAYEWLNTQCPFPGTDRNSSPGY